MGDNLLEFGHNFGADAIAGKEQKLEGRHGPSRYVRGKRGRVLNDFKLARKPDFGPTRRGRHWRLEQRGFRSKSQPVVSSFPRMQEIWSFDEALLDTRVRGHPGVAVETNSMSVVNSAAADGFIQRLPKEIGFYLVHGLDEGLTHERVKAIVRSRIGDNSDPMRLVRFEGDARCPRSGRACRRSRPTRSRCSGDPRHLDRYAGTRSLAGARALFARPPTDCTIVVKAGQLEGTGLRAAFENSAARASIECYADNSSTLNPSSTRKPELRVSPSRRMRAQHWSIWSAPTVERRAGEIAELMLYAHGQSQITAEDVEAIVADAAHPTSMK